MNKGKNKRIQMTTTDKYQVNPDYYMSIEECKNKNKDVQTNPRYSNFQQTHYTAGDVEQFEAHRDKTNGSLCMKSIDMSLNVFAQLHDDINRDKDTDSKVEIGENVDWSKYQNLTTSSVDNTFNYIFYKLKKGCFVKIKDNKLDVFLPFSNAAFVNEWGNRMKQDPSKWKSMEDFLIYVSRLAGYNYVSYKHINPDPSTWYGNNCLIRSEWPISEGDSDMTNMKDMLLTLCAERQVPDMEFFINKRDFPLLKKDGTEPYDAIWDVPTKLLSHDYPTYSPILSQVTTDDNADIAMPTWEDWQRVSSVEDGKVFDNCRVYTENFDSISWSSKKPIAVFRGASTGCGTTPETNPRLKLALLSKQNKRDSDGLPFLDAGITKWNLRPRKEPGNQYLTTIEYQRWGLNKVDPLSPLQQAQYKYIVHVDGHVSAFRLSYEMGSGSVILLADSKYRMWFRKYLVPYKHYVPVKADLSDLYEQIRWCKENDEECQKIVKNARDFYDTYLSKKGVLDFFQALLVRMKSVNGIYIYNSEPPRQSLIYREIEIIKEKMNQYPDTQVQTVNPIPYREPKSFGLMCGIRYLFNKMCSTGEISKYIVKGDKIHQSKNMDINRCKLFDTDFFLMKTLTNDEKDREFMHDIFVGMCVNHLLLEIPNFVYTLGITPSGEMIRENVPGKTLSEWLRSPQYSMNGLMTILIQAILAIRVAQLRCGFVHYDMYPWNIIVSPLPKPVPIDYRIGTNQVYRLITPYLVTIIDYGKSHVVHNNVHHGENIMFDMPQFQDVLTVVFSSLYELISQQRQFSKPELNVMFGMVNFFAGTSILKKRIDNVRELKSWLQYARKYNNILQYAQMDIGTYDPIMMVNFINNNMPHDSKLEFVDKVVYTPNIGNERLVYELMVRTNKDECYDAVFDRLMTCEMVRPKTRIEQAYTHQLTMRLLNDSMKLIPKDQKWVDKYRQVVNRLNEVLGAPIQAKMFKYNKYVYPVAPTRTPYNVNTFSNPQELDRVEVDMRCYVMPDYINARNIIESVLTLPNSYLSQAEKDWFRSEMSNILNMNTFAVLHELADKGTFNFLLWSSVEKDIDYIRSTIGDTEGCDRSMQIASNYALILKRRQDEMRKMKI